MTTYSDSRKVLRLSGADVRDFLQGLITNDINRVDDGMIYSALLTPQGKLIADFFLQADGDAILLDADGTIADALAQRLTMYKLRADVVIESTELCVSRGNDTPPSDAHVDPRDTTLGWRLISDQAQPESDADFDALHVAAKVPQWGKDLGTDSYILEMDFERLSGVDFRKGCYVGQEVTARMKHKTELRKGLSTVGIEGPAKPGDEITANGKTVGVLGTCAQDRALAYLRFDRVADDMKAGDARVFPLS